MKKSPTIHDIAKKTNVSSATVSRVLSNSEYPVSPAMREKILQTSRGSITFLIYRQTIEDQQEYDAWDYYPFYY